jgi:predicted O-methyltransferase YrrM
MTGNAFLHYLKVLTGSEASNTQTTEKERNALVKYSSNAGSIVEIGVFEGVNTALMASHMGKDGVLYGIDPFFKGRLGICYSKLITHRNLKKSKIVKKVRLIEKLSFDAAGDVPDKVDFIFIDGDHSYEGIKKDWELFSKKVPSKGIIALHDTSVPSHNPGVENLGSVKFFREVISKSHDFDTIETVDSLNILRRR